MIEYKTLKDVYLDFFEHDSDPMHEDDFKKLAEALRKFYSRSGKLPSGYELTKLVRKYSDDQSQGVPELSSPNMDCIMQDNMRSTIKWLQEQGF